jgi:alcohol dehydrogenase, propanol-preferring
MLAMVLESLHAPLQERNLPIPIPGNDQVLVKVRACGVCRTDLHIVDGELPSIPLPLIPGHEIVGEIISLGDNVDCFQIGDRIGIPWLGYTCGLCHYCLNSQENLCDAARFTGYTLNGGYAEYAVADYRYCFLLPERYSDVEVAPLLCAGLIGYRAFSMVGKVKRLGLYGFGAAAHILTPIALSQGQEIFALTRPGDKKSQDFTRSLGASWAGDCTQEAPVKLDAALIFAPDGALIPLALQAVSKGGTVVCAGIHMSAIPSFPYHLLWGERKLCSVANLTRQDAANFFGLLNTVHVQTHTHPFPLTQANEALEQLRKGSFEGAAVLVM